MGVAEILVGGGVAALLAAVVGGGLKAFGVELPLLASVQRQSMLLLVGVALIGLGLYSGRPQNGSLAATPTEAPAAAGKAGANDTSGSGTGTGETAATPAGPPETPNVSRMSFPAARRLIISEGWSPIFEEADPATNPNLGLRGEEVAASGFREAATCSGTGAAPCLLRYHKAGHVLQLVVLGETLEAGMVDMVEVIDCTRPGALEACLALR